MLPGLIPVLRYFHHPLAFLAVGLVLCGALLLYWCTRTGPSFYPPRHNALVSFITRALALPLLMRYWNKVVRVEFVGDSLDTLATLKGQRVVLCPNHPSRPDSDLAVYLSWLLRDHWNYLAAREVFDPPPQGWFLQQLGAYSVIRGTRDGESFRMTRQLLAAGKKWLVLFPEGETCGQNDTIMPFQPGIVQFAFWALEDLQATNPQSSLPPLYVVPIALKYIFIDDMQATLDHALTRLERTVGIAEQGSKDLYRRLCHVGEAVLVTAEREYGVQPPANASFDTRVQVVKEVIVSKVAADVGVVLRPEQPLLESIRALFNAVDRIVQEEPAATGYARQLQRQHQQHVNALYEDLWRALRFVATYDGYVRETMTVERFVEIITRLEWEVFGVVRWRGPRKVMIQVGTPIDVSAQWEAYRQDKRGTVATLIGRLEGEVRAMVTALAQAHATPLTGQPTRANEPTTPTPSH